MSETRGMCRPTAHNTWMLLIFEHSDASLGCIGQVKKSSTPCCDQCPVPVYCGIKQLCPSYQVAPKIMFGNADLAIPSQKLWSNTHCCANEMLPALCGSQLGMHANAKPNKLGIQCYQITDFSPRDLYQHVRPEFTAPRLNSDNPHLLLAEPNDYVPRREAEPSGRGFSQQSGLLVPPHPQ